MILDTADPGSRIFLGFRHMFDAYLYHALSYEFVNICKDSTNKA